MRCFKNVLALFFSLVFHVVQKLLSLVCRELSCKLSIIFSMFRSLKMFMKEKKDRGVSRFSLNSEYVLSHTVGVVYQFGGNYFVPQITFMLLSKTFTI